MKPKITPTIIKSFARCLMAGAFHSEGNKPQFDQRTRLRHFKGILFEDMLSDEYSGMGDPEYIAWKNARAKRETIDRIGNHADMVKAFYLDFDRDHEQGKRHSIEFPDIIIEGIEDYYGYVFDNEKPHAQWWKAVVDFKFTGKIEETYSEGIVAPELAIQSTTYCLLRAMDGSKKDLFFDAIKAAKRREWDKASELVGEWEASTSLPAAFILAIEDKDTGDEMPYVKPIHITYEALDLLHIYFKILQEISGYYDIMAHGYKEWTKEGNAIVQPDQFKCLGKGGMNHMGGYCPFLPKCQYGRTVIGQPVKVPLSEIINPNQS